MEVLNGSFSLVNLLIQKYLHLLESIRHKSHLLYSVKQNREKTNPRTFNAIYFKDIF